MSSAPSVGAARAAAALALLGAVHGARPVAPEPAPCPHPQLGAAEGLVQVRCDAAAGRAERIEGAAVLLFGGRLDPNRATPRALEALPGIGPARAAAIVREAEARGFCEPADLERVPGIGPVTRMRLAEWIETRAGACGE